MRLVGCALLLVQAAVCFTQEAPTVYAGLLERVRERMALQARQLPNYTCTEHITRSMFAGNPRRLLARDRVRLEVALAGGRELFA